MMNQESALSVLLKCAQEYENNLRDRNYLFIVRDKHARIMSYEVEFDAGNFYHLTGVKITPYFKNRFDLKKEVAKKFYEVCLDQRLSVKDFSFAEDGTTPLKLEVLPELMKKTLSANSIGDFDSRTYKLYTEKVAGNIRGCMGFIADQCTKKNIPNTVLKIGVRDVASNPKQILITYRKRKQEQEYTEIVYTAKHIQWDLIEFPKELCDLPKP